MVHFNPYTATGDLIQGRYRVQQTLGVRLGRRTLLAYDTSIQVPVIIKYLCLDDDLQLADIDRFKREVRVLKRLNHPAIAHYLDSFEVNTPTYRGLMLVQNYVEGQPLSQLLSAGCTFSETDLKQLAVQVLNILQYLHQQTPSIIHRDLKPSNLVLANRSAQSIGTLYLVDLGLVQTADTPAPTLMISGTAGYRPPEQFGDRAVPASDLYSLGATLIHLASHDHPAELPYRGLRMLFAQKLGHYSRPFKRWLRWLTEPRIEKRPRSAHEALQSLEKANILFGQSLNSPNLPRPWRHRVKLPKVGVEASQLTGTQLQLIQKPNSWEVVIPAIGFQGMDRSLSETLRQVCLSSIGLGIVAWGGAKVGSLVAQTSGLVSSLGGLILWQVIPGISLLLLGLWLAAVSSLSLWRGAAALLTRVQRQVRIQLEPDILLVGYESPFQSLRYVVNARKEDVYDIDMRPDGSLLYLFLTKNRTHSGQLNYHLSARELALTVSEMHWLNDVLHTWLKRSNKLA